MRDMSRHCSAALDEARCSCAQAFLKCMHLWGQSSSSTHPRQAGTACAGYLRMLGVIYAFAAADTSVVKCLMIYFVSFACDALDGKFARMFNQTSRLGAVLDMATDRVATAGLLALLCKFAPRYHLVWITLIMMDVGSHWFQMYVTLASGESTHKVRSCFSRRPARLSV
jgi:phosphatidylglycerophosphate synthase